MEQRTWTGERLETFIFSENTNEHLHRYALAIELARGLSVLDIACGEGYGCNLLASVAAKVTGVDIDAATIQRAKQKYPASNVQFTTGACHAIPFPDHSFDLLVSFETIEHHDQHQAMMQEIKRVLKPEGTLIISSPDKKYYSDEPDYKNPFHVAELYKHEFEALMEKYFKHIQHLSQRSFSGSVIVQENTTSQEPVKLYNGGYDKITQTGLQGVYCIAIASDKPLPQAGNSFFDGAAVLTKQFKQLSDYVTGTVTERVIAEVTARVTVQVTEQVTAKFTSTRRYRIGSAIMGPFSYLKRVLNA
jgi:ubiquinone/menaquinone biosynthesis C-methylase UbiE